MFTVSSEPGFIYLGISIETAIVPWANEKDTEVITKNMDRRNETKNTFTFINIKKLLK